MGWRSSFGGGLGISLPGLSSVDPVNAVTQAYADVGNGAQSFGNETERWYGDADVSRADPYRQPDYVNRFGKETGHTGAYISTLGASEKYHLNPGQSGDYIFGGRRKAQSRAETAEQVAAIKAEIARRNALLDRLNAAFGIGSTADAVANKSRLEGLSRKYYDAVIQSNLRDAENAYAGATRIGRQNLARVGQLGSGLDASSRSSNLADFLRARQRSISLGAEQRSRLQNNIENQRMGLASQISGGTLLSPDWEGITKGQQRSYDEARGEIPVNAAANLFNVAGSAYTNGRIQEAQGNQGLAAFVGPSSSGRGRIS
jgi:hypothetical protein